MHTQRRLFMSTAAILARAKSYYDVLQVPTNADKKQIKSQFYKLSMQHHPDRNANDPSAHQKFLELNEAYTALMDEAKRVEYDRTMAQQAGRSTASPYRRTRTGPRTAMHRSDKLRPDDWIQHKPPNRTSQQQQQQQAPKFDFEAHRRGHYGENLERILAQRKAQAAYRARMNDMRRTQRSFFVPLMLSTFVVFFLIAAVPMIYLEPADVDDVRNEDDTVTEESSLPKEEGSETDNRGGSQRDFDEEVKPPENVLRTSDKILDYNRCNDLS
ncbi:hypothetical protein BJ742DRAFT_826293 [Cladochytrium replicatum]|nr:hypothetical protein BJ742DRAFT_826293 [Cladochytrium replicatum]